MSIRYNADGTISPDQYGYYLTPEGWSRVGPEVAGSVREVDVPRAVIDAAAKAKQPLQRGFTYEVRLNVSIPLAWATLLKAAAKYHYDLRCNEAGNHGVINGLFNTAMDSEFPSTYPVTWSNLDLTTKVAEQLEYHTNDHALIRTIRAWLRETMDAIEHRRNACLVLP